MSEMGHSLRGRPGGKSGHAPLHAPSVLSAKGSGLWRRLLRLVASRTRCHYTSY